MTKELIYKLLLYITYFIGSDTKQITKPICYCYSNFFGLVIIHTFKIIK